MSIKIKDKASILGICNFNLTKAEYFSLGLLVINNSLHTLDVLTPYGERFDISNFISLEDNDEFEEIAMTKIADPLDDRDGVWFDIAGITALRNLPAGTKIYIKKPKDE